MTKRIEIERTQEKEHTRTYTCVEQLEQKIHEQSIVGRIDCDYHVLRSGVTSPEHTDVN